MENNLTNELYWLTLTLAMTAAFWMPYILNRMAEGRIWPALFNPQPDKRPKAQWAERMMRAHENAVENLVIFAPLVLIVQLTTANSPLTATACMVYFFARLAHYLLYTFKVPLLRTIAFFIGFLCQMVLVFTLV